jgi:mannose-6-phosphate isomerase class I
MKDIGPFMPTPRYRLHPVHIFPWLDVRTGHDALAAELQRHVSNSNAPALVVIDGFVGVQWDRFIRGLRSALAQRGLDAHWVSTEACFLPPAQIDRVLAPVLTDDPVFGRLFRGRLEELWDPERANSVRREVAASQRLTILSGFGASCLATGGIQVYVDMPKDRGQGLAARGAIRNVGARAPEAFDAMYKRLYFVDWPVLNRIKRATLPGLDLFVDATDVETPAFVRGDAMRRALHELARRPFRVKPWFAPGPWGGQWMKERFGLPPEQPNYAWSFELIAPENGVLLGDGARELECSFDYLLWQETEAVLGVPVAARYGSYFPLRFDYLDTMGGANLSCQVHPRLDYIRDEFGESLTQDETYYILTCKPGARVFLGLRDDVDLARFRADATAARDRSIPFEITDHVHSLPSAPHDLFLIPSGTVHCSGADNLVLEISATPYIYTFKIYDYLRGDLNGNLRHVHLDHAFANIDAARTATWARTQRSRTAMLLREGPTWAEYRIGESDRLFFAVHRLDFAGEMEDDTGGKFIVLNLVEGERCDILTGSNEPVELRFAESIVIPAAVGRYTLCNTGGAPCKAVKAFVKG